jgi:serpin B
MTSIKKKDQKEALSIIETVAAGNTRLALDLYQQLRSNEGNLFFSPYSISSALAMTYAGARENTQKEMAQALHFPEEQDVLHEAFDLLNDSLVKAGKKRHVQMRIANNLFPSWDHPFRKAYLKLLKKYYGVRVTPLDYGDEESARDTINKWVEERTENRIQDLIGDGVLNSLTKLVLVNAIYFKGDWKNPFDADRTGEAPFRVGLEEEVTAAMMNGMHRFRYAENDLAQMLELPYAGDDLVMDVLLPAEDQGMAKLEDALTVENLSAWLGDMGETEVEVTLPRFELTFPFRLDEALKSLGMLDAFTDRADFSGMDGSRELFIGAVLHKAFVAVNEEGTEAAAATAVVMQTKMMAMPPVVFRADHPFLFLIREIHSGSVLFIGRVTNPA